MEAELECLFTASPRPLGSACPIEYCKGRADWAGDLAEGIIAGDTYL